MEQDGRDIIRSLMRETAPEVMKSFRLFVENAWIGIRGEGKSRFTNLMANLY